MSLSSIQKALSVAVAFAFVLGFACSLYPEEIVIVHSNDTHGIIKPSKIDIKNKERLVG